MKKSCGVAAVGLWMQFVPALLEASQERWALTEELRFEGSSWLPLSTIQALVASPNGTVFVAGADVGGPLRLDASTLWLRFTLPGGMHAAAEQPWSTRDLLTASPGGDGFAIVRGRGTDREVGRYEVLWFDTGAELVRSRSVTFRAAPLDDAVIDSFLDGVSSGFGERYGANVGPLRRAITDALYTPEYLPGVGTTRRGWSGGGVLLSEDGSTWVRQQDADGSRWVVFDRAGASVAEVSAPEDLDLHHLSADHAWGVREDAFGTPIVYRYAISRG